MSYESKIIIANVRDCIKHYIDGLSVPSGETVAVVNCCYMGQDNGWRELFRDEIDFALFVDDRLTMEDCYGDVMREADPDELLEWLEMHETNYRRAHLLKGLLQGLDPDEWENIRVVHYGY